MSVLTASFLMASNISIAEDGKRYDKSVTWKNVVKINFKPGKRDEALKIISDYYRPATVKAKTPAPEVIMELQTGDYDLLVVWHMEGGVNDLTWEKGPNGKKWRAALNEIAGGEEKAQEILDQYVNYIDNAENNIALVR
ncbi:hypothetical protein RGQ13_13285 [Thalassotalea psychrophila]|uniref:Uncharacterized protein n=1 Tax=Thalassotalea psychrophila TaxID=3065647 RepID=A0ABY9TQJ0_9GAMM|nr:hypothetical protein RGQ13_13285 [Colwelliaceae bacterium SQ149]